MLAWGPGDAGPAEGAVVAVPAVVTLAEALIAVAVAVALVDADLLRAYLASRSGKAVVHAPAPVYSCCCQHKPVLCSSTDRSPEPVHVTACWSGHT